MAHITLELPEKLMSVLERRVDSSGVSVAELICRTLEFYFPRILGQPKVDTSKRPEVRRAIQLQDEIRKRHEGSGYSGSAIVREMRDRGW